MRVFLAIAAVLAWLFGAALFAFFPARAMRANSDPGS